MKQITESSPSIKRFGLIHFRLIVGGGAYDSMGAIYLLLCQVPQQYREIPRVATGVTKLQRLLPEPLSVIKNPIREFPQYQQ